MTTPSSAPAAGAPLTDDTIPAAQHALAAEHAAIWSYTFASAFVSGAQAATVADGASSHQARRDAIERLIKDAGTAPVPAQPTYSPPKPVTDPSSAAVLLATAESDCAQAWRSVLEHTDDQQLRRSGLDALTSAAVRGARWRLTANLQPAVVAFPGTP